MREFNYFVNYVVSKRAGNNFKCENCLIKCRDMIHTLFSFFDCDDSGFIDA